MRFVSCLVLLSCSVAQADEIEDGAAALAGKIAAHLSPQERAHLSVRNISGLPPADATRAQAALEAALPKHVRTRRVITVSLTFSENPAGYVWVAEIHKGEVEMVAVANPAVTAPVSRQLLTRRLLWEQREAILDVVQQGDRTVILGDRTVTIMHAEKRSDLALDIPRVRDPRGRLELDGNTLTTYFPGATCRGTGEPLHLDCNDASSEFLLNGKQVRFVPGRNTIAGVQREDDAANVCAAMKLSPVKENMIAIVSPKGVIRDQAELPGALRELWPAGDGAVVVIRNQEADKYAAYAISVDCSSH